MKNKNPYIEMKMQNLMKNIKRKIKERGYTQKTFSQVIGVSATTFSKWILRKSSPTADKLVKIAKALNCSIESLIND